jgi:GTP cyclohydrolase I
MMSFDVAFDPDEQDVRAAMHLHGRSISEEQMRGVREVAPLTRTTFWRGEYDSNAALRAEFLDMCGVRQ